MTLKYTFAPPAPRDPIAEAVDRLNRASVAYNETGGNVERLRGALAGAEREHRRALADLEDAREMKWREHHARGRRAIEELEGLRGWRPTMDYASADAVRRELDERLTAALARVEKAGS